MKELVFILLTSCILSSCSKDDSYDLDKYPQKWQLVKMTGQIGTGTTSTNMEWQEYYLLNSDGTFIKSRERNGILTEVSGTFSFKDLTDGKFLELTYEISNPIIGSCYSATSESLWLKSANKMVGTWLNCDGPGLEYERIK